VLIVLETDGASTFDEDRPLGPFVLLPASRRVSVKSSVAERSLVTTTVELAGALLKEALRERR
jgi:hypothetical protein